MANMISNPDVRKKSLAQTLSLILEGFGVFSLLAKLRNLDGKSPEDLVDIALKNSTIRPIQDRAEFLEFAQLIATQRPKNVLEIGTFRGGTLFVFARLSQPDATLISLDLPFSRFGSLIRKLQEPLLRSFTGSRQRLLLLREDSHVEETRSRVAKALDGPLDLLFIDGDHSYDGVKSDFEMYSPLVREAGIVAFHDIANARTDYGVGRFWNEAKNSFKYREIVNPSAAQALGIGVLWK
jgi:predicted O-methyltransferase YrrM